MTAPYFNFIVCQLAGGYEVVGPFTSREALAAHGRRWQAEHGDDARWQPIHLAGPHVPSCNPLESRSIAPCLSARLQSLSWLAAGNAKGLTAIGHAKLSDELAACAVLARLLESTNKALQDELLAEEALPDDEPLQRDPRQLDLTAGKVIVMPHLFPRDAGLRGPR